MTAETREAPAGADRRTEPRERCDVAVMVCRDIEGRGFVAARMMDRSDHGVCVVVPQPLQPGESFLLKLRAAALSISLYNAIHCHPSDGGYQIGAKLIRVVGEHPAGSERDDDARHP